MSLTTTATQIPGYVAGTWDIDASHSDVSFSVRHMMVSKVKGNFARFSGELVTADDVLNSSVTAEIELDSIDTRNEQRDGHIRSADFFDVENFPTMTYRSTGIRQDGNDFIVDGELTLRGVTKNVPLRLEINGFGPDAYGGTRAGFTGTTEINRTDFGVNWNGAIEAGGVVVSEKVTITLEIEAVLRQG
jgi:polyisoprenoid-binding protein YceI